MEDVNMDLLPKTIWFLWLQGFDNAPPIVKKCYETWKKYNPEWNLILLDENNIQEYITLKPRDITVQGKSNLIRLALLSKYGGVWVDSTCFCIRPLNEWLKDNMQAGFFAFNRPGPDRMLSTWFFAAYKGNYIAEVMLNGLNNFWDSNPGIRLIGNTEWAHLEQQVIALNPQIWFEDFLTKILKVHPYFITHYLFEKNYLSDEKFKQIWDEVPKITADIPHRVQFAGLLQPITNVIKQEINDKISPLYKLAWKYDTTANKEGTIIDYMLHYNG